MITEQLEQLLNQWLRRRSGLLEGSKRVRSVDYNEYLWSDCWSLDRGRGLSCGSFRKYPKACWDSLTDESTLQRVMPRSLARSPPEVKRYVVCRLDNCIQDEARVRCLMWQADKAGIYSIDEAAKNARASSSSREKKSKAQSWHEHLAHRQAVVKGQAISLVQAPRNILIGNPSEARLLGPLAEELSYEESRSREHADGRCRCRRSCGWRWNVS
ncbi:hypothetical protein BDW67DRAFT_90724 [Aspergillus spinulosporus]